MKMGTGVNHRTDSSAGDRQLVVHHEDPASPLRWRIGDVEVVRIEESVVEMSPLVPVA